MEIEHEIMKRIMLGYEFEIGSKILKLFRILLILYLVFYIPPAVYGFDQGGQWRGSIKTENGVTVVRNPQKPIFDDNIIEFEEELIIPESDGRNYIFAKLSGLALDENKNIYVLDSRDANIKVFNEHGQYLRSFGRKGAGPFPAVFGRR